MLIRLLRQYLRHHTAPITAVLAPTWSLRAHRGRAPVDRRTPHGLHDRRQRIPAQTWPSADALYPSICSALDR
jgi:hypothetical protein